MQELGLNSNPDIAPKTVLSPVQYSAWFQRPRTVFWEWLFYGRTSEFRKTLNTLSEQLQFGGFASLSLPLDFNNMFEMPDDGYMARLGLEELTRLPAGVDGYEISYQLGSTIGLWTWFGISGLESDNIVLAFQKRRVDSQVVFMPKNIESLFSEVTLPSDLGLSTDRKDSMEAGNAGGLTLVKELLFSKSNSTKGSVAALLQGYIETLALFDREQVAVKAALDGVPGIQATLIRTPHYPSTTEHEPHYMRRFDSSKIMFYKGIGQIEEAETSKIERAAMEMHRYKPRVIGSSAWSATWNQSATRHIGALQLAQELLSIPQMSVWSDTQVFCEHQFLYVQYQRELWRKEQNYRRS